MKKGKGNRRRRELQWSVAPRRAQPRLWDPDRDWPTPPPKRDLSQFPVDYAFVTDRIATGGGLWTDEDVDRLADAGITHVVTTADELIATTAALVEGRMAWLGNGTRDDGTWKPSVWFANTIAFTQDALAKPGTKVYLHCWSGKNRGPSSAYAALRAGGHSRVAAERLIRRARPKVTLLYRADAEQALERMGIR